MRPRSRRHQRRIRCRWRFPRRSVHSIRRQRQRDLASLATFSGFHGGAAMAGTENASLPFGRQTSFGRLLADARVSVDSREDGVVQVLSGPPFRPEARGMVTVSSSRWFPIAPCFGRQPTAWRPWPKRPWRGTEGHRAPHFLPDGRHFLFYAMEVRRPRHLCRELGNDRSSSRRCRHTACVGARIIAVVFTARCSRTSSTWPDAGQGQPGSRGEGITAGTARPSRRFLLRRPADCISHGPISGRRQFVCSTGSGGISKIETLSLWRVYARSADFVGSRCSGPPAGIPTSG